MRNWRAFPGAILGKIRNWRGQHASAAAGRTTEGQPSEPKRGSHPKQHAPATNLAEGRHRASGPDSHSEVPVDPIQSYLEAEPPPSDVDWAARAAELSVAEGSDASMTGRWLEMARCSAGLSHASLSRDLGHQDGKWSAQRCGANAKFGASIVDLKQVESLTGLPLPNRVRRAARPIDTEDTATLARLPATACAVVVYEDAVSRLTTPTVADEMAALAAAAASIRSEATRELDGRILRRMFGLCAASQPVPAIANEFGVSKWHVELVRQEALFLFDMVRSTLSTPALDELGAGIRGANNVPAVLMEKRCAALLGGVTLSDATRFLAAYRHDPAYRIHRLRVRASNEAAVSIVATGISSAARNLTVLSQAARALTRYAGACSLSSVVALATEHGFTGLPQDVLREMIGAFPGVVWLDEQKQWLTYIDEPSPLVRKAATMLALCGHALGPAVIYAGLAHAERGSSSTSRPAAHAAHLPSAQVVSRVLETHPWFAKQQSGAFSLAAGIGDVKNLDEYEAAVVSSILAGGGAATRQECGKWLFGSAMERRVSINTLNFTLNHSAYFVRLGRAVYGIRGQDVDAHIIEAAVQRGTAGRSASMAAARRAGRPAGADQNHLAASL